MSCRADSNLRRSIFLSLSVQMVLKRDASSIASRRIRRGFEIETVEGYTRFLSYTE